MDGYHGSVEQIPPIYSAKKFNGIRSYELARRGIVPDVTKKIKTVEIDSIKLVKTDNELEYTIKVTCGTGTYIRSISKYIGDQLDLCCHVRMIERTKYGPFNLKNILSIDRLMQLNHGIDTLDMVIRPVETVLDDILAVQVGNHDAIRLKNGSPIVFDDKKAGPHPDRVIVKSADKLIAICKLQEMQLKPVRVFNL